MFFVCTAELSPLPICLIKTFQPNVYLLPVPDKVWRLNLDVPEEAKNVSLDNSEDRWWEQVDLTKLLLVSNLLTELSEDIVNFPALTVLDVRSHRHRLPMNKHCGLSVCLSVSACVRAYVRASECGCS